MRVNAIAFFIGFNIFFVVENVFGQATCTSMATSGTGTIFVDGTYAGSGWNWASTGNFFLYQSANGGLSGSMATYASSSCSTDQNYNMSGVLNSSGQFSLTATYTGSQSGCAQTIHMNGTLTGPGCATANGTWNNSSGVSGSLAMTQSCQIPTGEAPSVFVGWEADTSSAYYQTGAQFNTTPAPTATYSWGGRKITESFPQTSSDTCWYPGSPLPKAAPIAASTTMTGNQGYSDTVGPSELAVNTYRKHGRTPCGFVNYQVLTIDCPTPPGNQQYFSNTLISSIGDVTVGASRAGVSSPTKNWGTPAPIITLTPLMNLLFLNHN